MSMTAPYTSLVIYMSAVRQRCKKRGCFLEDIAVGSMCMCVYCRRTMAMRRL